MSREKPQEDLSSFEVTKEFLENALRSKWSSSGTTIDKFKVSKGSDVGDGFTTILLTVDIWLTEPEKFSQFNPNVILNDKDESHLSVVIKCFPDNAAKQQFVVASDVFSTELGVYNKVTPALLKFQKNLNVPKILEPDFPTFISGVALTVKELKELKETRPLKPLDSYIMMLDIRKHGKYFLRDKFLGFDLDHHKLVMEAHAKLHAISWAYKCKLKLGNLRELFPFLQKFQTVNNIKMMGPFMKANVGVAQTIVTHLLNGDAKISKHLEELKSDNRLTDAFAVYYDYDPRFDPEAGDSEGIKSKFTKDSLLHVPGVTVENEDPWLVLLHGDAWSNNMLFRYDPITGKPVQIILLDLQISREGDPMCDLAYAIYTCTTRDYRSKHLTSMLHVYYDKFIEVCNYLSAPLLPNFTWDEFNRRFHRAKFYGMSIAIAILQIILKKQELILDMEKANIGTTKNDQKVKSNEQKSADQIAAEAQVEKKQAFLHLVGKDSTIDKLHPAVLERLSGLLQDMTEQGVL